MPTAEQTILQQEFDHDERSGHVIIALLKQVEAGLLRLRDEVEELKKEHKSEKASLDLLVSEYRAHNTAIADLVKNCAQRATICPALNK